MRIETGQYALGNLLFTPVPERHDGRRAAVGPTRECSRIRFVGDGLKLQFSFKYNFSATGRRLVT